MKRSDEEIERDRQQREGRFDRYRTEDLVRCTEELAVLDERRAELSAQVARLEKATAPIDEVRQMVEDGKPLLRNESARLAAEDPDLYNRLLDEGPPSLTG